ncbi:MAG: hypothetical protein PWP56_1303 [Acetobacterium sp.]|nr:hypothetical protein [Acetobacterium sp.]
MATATSATGNNIYPTSEVVYGMGVNNHGECIEVNNSLPKTVPVPATNLQTYNLRC